MKLIGLGQDSHAFVTVKKRKALILGGVKINFDYGLKGNSDADVILHSLCNALSSAIGGDSLSTWADSMCFAQNIKDSHFYVEKILNLVKKKLFKVINVSIAVEAKRPFVPLEKIHQMKQTIANLLEIKKERVGITFTSGENLTPFGKGKGIQAITIVNLTNEN